MEDLQCKEHKIKVSRLVTGFFARLFFAHLPAPRVLYRKFQQDTNEEIPHEVLYCGRLMQYLAKKRALRMYNSTLSNLKTASMFGS